MSKYSESVLLAAFFFPASAAVLVFFMKYVSAVLQARARFKQDEAYRELAMKVATAQADTARALTSLGAALGELQTRLTVVETILKQVE